ncbi:hypothetical protein WAE61_09035 [Comamonadaceae bacterium PP-2]
MTKVIQFVEEKASPYARRYQGTLPRTGIVLSVTASGRVDCIDLQAWIRGLNAGFEMTAADARALAAELIASADACDVAVAAQSNSVWQEA